MSATDVTPLQAQAGEVIRRWVTEEDLSWEEPAAGTFVLVLPGERKLRTTVSIVVGEHSASFNAFVARHPDENQAGLYGWLLERNLRMYGVAYAIDHLGDIYLTGRLALDAVTDDELDRWLGTIHEHADGDFNTILSLGFADAIRREWAWRLSRGESTANLAAFTHLLPDAP